MKVTLHFDENRTVTEENMRGLIDDKVRNNENIELYEIVSMHPSNESSPAQCTIDVYGDNVWAEILNISQTTPLIFEAKKK